MRTTQAKFAGERTSGYRETRLAVPDTSGTFLRMEWVATAPNFRTMLDELLF